MIPVTTWRSVSLANATLPETYADLVSPDERNILVGFVEARTHRPVTVAVPFASRRSARRDTSMKSASERMDVMLPTKGGL